MAVAKCSECGAEVDESASFCEKCGNEITKEVAQNRDEDNRNESAVKCSECGAEVDESSSFCSNCGAEVTVDESHRVEESHEESQTDEGQEPSYAKWRSGWWSSRGGLLVQGDEIKMKQPALNSNNWIPGLLLSVAIVAGLVSSFVFPLYGIVFLATVVFVAIYAMYPAALVVLVLFMPLSPIVMAVFR